MWILQHYHLWSKLRKLLAASTRPMQEFEQFEFFAGVGRVTEFATACGYKAVRFDILDHEPSESDSHSSNFMDLNTASGFAYLGRNSNNVFLFDSVTKWMIFSVRQNAPILDLNIHLRLAALCLLRARLGNFAAHFAIKCSSFSIMNVGTSRRSPCASIGYDEYRSVFSSNRLLERWGGIDRTHFQKTTNIEVLKKLIRSLHTVPSILTDCASPFLRALQDLCIDHFGHSPSWGVDVGAAGWVCPWVFPHVSMDYG